MRTKITASCLALCFFATASWADDGQQWMSISRINNQLEAAGYRNIEEIEREHGRYEVKATDRNGQRVKLHLHPRTGAITDARQQQPRGEKFDVRNPDKGQRNSADCNERRCRDDRTPVGAAAPAAAK